MTRSLVGKGAVVLFTLMIAGAVLLPAPAIKLDDAFLPLSWRNLLGTTPLGQSVVLQIIAGAGQTLFIAIGALAFSLVLSLVFTGVSFILPRGAARAYAFFIDAWLSIPGIFIALSIGYFLPQSPFSVLAALVLSEFAALQKFFLQRLGDVRKSDYITMANVMGAGNLHTLLTHVLPRLMREAGYLFFLTLPSIVLSLASLEFLGVQTGAERLSLGMQIAIYKDYILLYPNLSLAPVLCLLLLLAALHYGTQSPTSQKIQS
jgi:peptide/nickel transport system permease protein